MGNLTLKLKKELKINERITKYLIIDKMDVLISGNTLGYYNCIKGGRSDHRMGELMRLGITRLDNKRQYNPNTNIYRVTAKGMKVVDLAYEFINGKKNPFPFPKNKIN